MQLRQCMWPPAALPLPTAARPAGALFWQAALQEGPNTDGLNIYLDGSLALPPPEGQGRRLGCCLARGSPHA